jgi:alkylation response protein AidB-like acyl-CoA dehydrogenase
MALRAFRRAQGEGRSTSAQRDRLIQLWVRCEVANSTNRRISAPGRDSVGAEGSINKVIMAELNKATFEFVMNVNGAEGMLIDNFDPVRPIGASVHGGSDYRKAFLRTRANSIEGGTSEIMRNVLGEQVLGLPPEPRVDRGIPWNQTRRA